MADDDTPRLNEAETLATCIGKANRWIAAARIAAAPRRVTSVRWQEQWNSPADRT